MKHPFKPNELYTELIHLHEYLVKIQIQGIGDEMNMKAALRILDYLIRMAHPQGGVDEVI